MADIYGRRFQNGSYVAPPGCTLTTADDVVIEIDVGSDYSDVDEDVNYIYISILDSNNNCVKKFYSSRCCLLRNSLIKPSSRKIKLPIGTYTIGGFTVNYSYNCIGTPTNCGSSYMSEVSCATSPPLNLTTKTITKNIDIPQLYNLADCTTLTITQAPACTQPSCTMTIQ